LEIEVAMHSSVSMRLSKVCHLAHIILQVHFTLLRAKPVIENTFFLPYLLLSTASSNTATTVLLRLQPTQIALLKSYEIALNLMEYVVIFFPAIYTAKKF